jgi:hypothetical protein
MTDSACSHAPQKVRNWQRLRNGKRRSCAHTLYMLTHHISFTSSYLYSPELSMTSLCAAGGSARPEQYTEAWQVRNCLAACTYPRTQSYQRTNTSTAATAHFSAEVTEVAAAAARRPLPLLPPPPDAAAAERRRCGCRRHQLVASSQRLPLLRLADDSLTRRWYSCCSATQHRRRACSTTRPLGDVSMSNVTTMWRVAGTRTLYHCPDVPHRFHIHCLPHIQQALR